MPTDDPPAMAAAAASAPLPDPGQIEFGRRLFAGPCDFVRGALTADQLPEPDLPEVAFAGRSNVGKSSLINALTGRNDLARASNTPGRTRQINFFDLGGRLMLVDLPGYGYARASKKEIIRWNRLIHDYLRGRPNLRRVVLLIDARHGLKDSDEAVMTVLDDAAVSTLLVLTKIDKLPAGQRDGAAADLRKAAAGHVTVHPRLYTTSARDGAGISLLRAELGTLALGAQLG